MVVTTAAEAAVAATAIRPFVRGLRDTRSGVRLGGAAPPFVVWVARLSRVVEGFRMNAQENEGYL